MSRAVLYIIFHYPTSQARPLIYIEMQVFPLPLFYWRQICLW